MNTQDIFDIISNHMLIQGNRWGNYWQRDRAWSYINPDNQCERCIKGLFIDKDKAEAIVLNNKYAKWIDLVEGGMGRKLLPKEELLMTAAEYIFETTSYECWEGQLEVLANKLNLIFKMKREKVCYLEKELII